MLYLLIKLIIYIACVGCATCTDINTCIIPCNSNCKSCTSDQTCTKPMDGFYIDPTTNVAKGMIFLYKNKFQFY